MGEITYSLSYLPMFFNDLEDHVRYISDVLQNKTAANDLLDAVEAVILKRIPDAESFEPYHSIREHLYPYYRIYVKNYTIYYVVIPDVEENKRIMEVRRILHNLQNRDDYL